MFDKVIYLLNEDVKAYGDFLIYSHEYKPDFIEINWAWLIEIINIYYKINIAFDKRSNNFKQLIINEQFDDNISSPNNSITKIRTLMFNNTNNIKKLKELFFLECMIKGGHEELVINYLNCQYI